MDGTVAINNNLAALKRVLAGLCAMAGFALSAGSRPTLPRHLRLAILRLLRPAESAARRLIIAAARGIVVTLPPTHKTGPKPVTPDPQLRRLGIAVVLPSAMILPRSRGRGTGEAGGRGGLGYTSQGAGPSAKLPHPDVLANEPRRTALPLFDPSRRFRPRAGHTVPAHRAPRILLPGIAEPHRLPPPPSPDDPIDATRLNQRLAALAAALDDLPAQAKRFARWQARRQRGRQRLSPLRPGRPPGGRLSRFDPSARTSSRIREVDEILAYAHALALHALQHPDTS